MPKEIIMPQMGESVAEGTITKWLIHEGEKIKKDQSIVEISTDKVDTEVPAPVTGILKKILHHVDETVPVGTVIGIIEEEKVAEAAVPPGVTSPVEARKVPEGVVDEKRVIGERVEVEKRHSPLVRRLAVEYGVDLREIRGTGAGGRITKQDVLDYVKTMQKIKIPPVPGAEEIAKEEEAREELIPLSPKRKIIAERMVQSKRTAPHVTTTFEVDITNISRYREAHKEALLKGQGVHLTYLPFLISAACEALKTYPAVNSSWTDQGIVIKRYIHIGIAVSIEDGLIVPVIRDADKKSLIELARENQDLAQRAREKRLKVDEVQGGTFTITNYGIGGSLFGTPVIMPPQAAILGIGAITKRPVVINDAIAIRNMVYLSLSFDHRVIDGAQADQFLTKVKEVLEGWGEKVEKVSKPEKVSPPESGFGGVW